MCSLSGLNDSLLRAVVHKLSCVGFFWWFPVIDFIFFINLERILLMIFYYLQGHTDTSNKTQFIFNIHVSHQFVYVLMIDLQL